MILIITPVYRSYHIVREMCEAIDKYTVNPFLHILVDDDSNCGEFPIKASKNRRILMMKKDYEGIIRKTGEGQAIQLAYDWANQPIFNGEINQLPYQYVFLIEADVIVKEGWDKKMIDLIPTLPTDWLTLDVQSTDFEEKLTYPTTNWGSKVGEEREDLEITHYPDFQCTLFNWKIFDAGINFASLVDPVDSFFGRAVNKIIDGKHYRTKLVSVYHYISQSIKYLETIKIENLIERVKDIDSYIFDDDLRIYHKYASVLPDGSTILDVGTGKGKSAITLALSNAKSTVITVDNGTRPIVDGWVNSSKDYVERLNRTIKNHGVNNYKFIYDDIFNILGGLPNIDLFHLDDEELETDILKAVLPLVKNDGILLVRNYLRFKEEVDRMCKNYEYLEYGGLIQVIRKNNTNIDNNN